MPYVALIIGGLIGLVLFRLMSPGRSVPGDVGEVLAKLDAPTRQRLSLKVKAGDKISAIKELRERVDTDLLTAKTAVEELAKRRD